MLRFYLVQNLYDLSDMAAIAEVIGSRAFSDFAEWNRAIRYRLETHWGVFEIC